MLFRQVLTSLLKNDQYCCVAPANVTPPRIFQHTSNCEPIAAKSRRYSRADHEFILLEVEKILEEGIIEPSLRPWRAQVVVTKDERHENEFGGGKRDKFVCHLCS